MQTMETFPPFVYQTLAQMSPKQRDVMQLLAEQDRTLFWQTILKLRKYQRIQKTGNIQAWKAFRQEQEETLTTLDL